jgi:hypothetical protein
MGCVIRFPDERQTARDGQREARDESATIVILPVIRIERFAEPDGIAPEGNAPGRKPPRPTSRS